MSDAQIEVTSTFCYGGAGPNDDHLLADIVAVDGDIVRWLERRDSAARCGTDRRYGNRLAVRTLFLGNVCVLNCDLERLFYCAWAPPGFYTAKTLRRSCRAQDFS